MQHGRLKGIMANYDSGRIFHKERNYHHLYHLNQHILHQDSKRPKSELNVYLILKILYEFFKVLETLKIHKN